MKYMHILAIYAAVLPQTILPKMSTGEKIAVSASAAGIALTACFFSDALEELEESIYHNEYLTLDNDELLDEVAYQTRKIKNIYHYEIELAIKYERTTSWRTRDNIKDDLRYYVSKKEKTISSSIRIYKNICQELADLRYNLENQIDYSTFYNHKKKTECYNYLNQVNNLIDHFHTILDILKNTLYDTSHYQTHYRYYGEEI